MDIVYLAAERPGGLDRIGALNDQVGRIQIQAEHIGELRSHDFTEFVEGADIVHQCAGEFLNGNLLNAVVPGELTVFLPPGGGHFPLVLHGLCHIVEALIFRP